MKSLILALAIQHHMDPSLLEAFICVESSYGTGLIHKNKNGTVDLGPMQVNSKNLNIFEYSRILKDKKFGIEKGIEIYKNLRKRYSEIEAIGRYNVGNGLLVGKRLENFNLYIKKINTCKRRFK